MRTRLRGVAVLLIVLIATLGSERGAFAQPADNPASTLVRNPSFEEATGDGRLPAHWGHPRSQGIRAALDETAAHTGKRCGRIEATDPDQPTPSVHAWRQWVAPIADEPLWLSVWTKADGVTEGSIRLLHRDRDGDVLLTQTIQPFRGTFSWKELAGPVEQVEGVESLEIVIGLTRSPGTVWFDDVSLTPLGDRLKEAGRAAISPVAPQVAGAVHPVTFEIVLGKVGLGEGGRVLARWDSWTSGRSFAFRRLAAQCDVPGVRFETEIVPRRKTWPPEPRPIAWVVTVADGPALGEGAKVTVNAEMMYSKQSNVRSPMAFSIAPRAGSTARPLAGRFVFASKGGHPARLVCIAESRPIEGKPGRLTVAAVDQHGNPCALFRGVVRLSDDAGSDLPVEYTFTERDAGSHVFAVTLATDKASRITATYGSMQATSNPILPRPPGESGIYFGDIHAHSEISFDGVGDPELAYDYARRFHGLDFATLADHSPRAAQWQRTMEITNRHNEPGTFATILGFEWSDSRHGHRNAYYRGDAGPEQPEGLRSNMEDWWRCFDEEGVPVITVPHHPNTQARAILANGKPAWGPTDWSVVNHKYQRVVELNQNRGSFEAPGGPIKDLRIRAKDVGASVQTALAKGHHLGFIGSTDTHGGRPGSGRARCAVIAQELTREALWDGLHARRCYATSGKHILLFFTVNERPMGSEITAEGPAIPRRVAWRVIGTGTIERVDLLRSNVVVKSWQGDGASDVSGTFALDTPLVETEWWYVRAIQEDTEMAWSSPVWVARADQH